MLFLIAHQFFLGGFHLHLHIDELSRQPLGGVHGGVVAGFSIFIDVGLHQSVDDSSCPVGIGAAVMHLDDACIREECDSADFP